MVDEWSMEARPGLPPEAYEEIPGEQYPPYVPATRAIAGNGESEGSRSAQARSS